MIWLYWAVSIGQWLPVFVNEAGRLARRENRGNISIEDRWLWCWILVPLVFFTASRNIIITYTLTAIPPLAVVAARWAESHNGWMRRMTPQCVFAFSIIVSIIGLTWLPGELENLSARKLVADARATDPNAPIAISGCYQFSGSFYTNGTAVVAPDIKALADVIHQPSEALIVSEDEADIIRQELKYPELSKSTKGVLFKVPATMVSHQKSVSGL
jgi:hypothetical protein